MAKRRTPATAPPAVTLERAARLCRLLRLLGTGPKTRDTLTRRLKLDVRGFYRDLQLLRAVGIGVTLEERRYTLDEDADDAIARLPFPDPHLTLAEARQLARGRTRAHEKLRAQIAQILP